MIKRLFTYWALTLAISVFPFAAQADIEALQTVLGNAKTVIKEAETVQQDLNQLQMDARSLSEGTVGPLKDAAKTVGDNVQAVNEKVDAAKNIANDPEGSLNTMGGKLPGFMTTVDTNDSQKLQDSVKTNYFSQRRKSSDSTEGQAEAVDSIQENREQQEKMAAVQRENFANLYAQAFTIRTNLAKEKAEENKEHKDSREILQNTKEIALKMEDRWRKIMIINAALFEFKTTQYSRQFSFVSEEDEDDEE